MSQPELSTPFVEPLPEPVRPALHSVGEESDALLSAVAAALVTLRMLFRHEQLFESAALDAVRGTVDSVEKRLARQELRVVVVGERQSGKSTLLDAIVGDRLLGGARGESRAPTFIRRRDVLNYVARFSSGMAEDFSRIAPDPSRGIEPRAPLLEQRLAAKRELCAAAHSALRKAIEARENAELAVSHAEMELEGARTDGAAEASELSGVETEASRIETALVAIEVPNTVRRARSGWAPWLWFLRLFFALWNRRVWAHYQTLSLEHGEIRSRLLEGRSKTVDRAAQLTFLTQRLQPLVESAAAARAQAGEAELALRAAEKERDDIRAEIERVQSEREHREAERRRHFLSNLGALNSKRPGGATLTELSIDYPARLLPDDVTIIDMPGAFSETAPEWLAIREQVDGCIFVSEIDRAVSESAKGFLRRLREVIPHLLLVLTKVDEAIAEAGARGGDPWQQVERARRIGTRRFARELGREPESVLSIAVAAEVALAPRHSELARRFETEIGKLFQLLRHERAIILGTHAGTAIRRCIGGIAEAEQRAERTYRDMIGELERQRTPHPGAFGEEQLALAEAAITAAARQAIVNAAANVSAGFLAMRQVVRQQIDACNNQKSLLDAVEQLSRRLPEESAGVHRAALLHLYADIDGAVDAIAGQLFAELRQQYRLLHVIERGKTSSLDLCAPSAEASGFASVVSDVRSTLHSFNKSRYLLALGAMTMGAAAGALVRPWAGVAGAAFGALLSLVRRERALRERAVEIVTADLAKQEQAQLEELRSAEGAAVSAIRAGCRRALDDAIVRFGRWIAEPLEAEQRAIDDQRERLAELERLRTDLGEHDRELERLLNAAADASVGLCR